MEGAINKKSIMIGGGILIFLVLVFLILSSLNKKSKENVQIQNNQIPSTNTNNFDANPADPAAMSESEAKAYEEQKKVDEEYGEWQAEVKTDYPWFRKFPVMNDKYYVYFDLDKKKFIGFIYPVVGDDTDVMKSDILKLLKDKKGVPVEKFTFEWTIKPK